MSKLLSLFAILAVTSFAQSDNPKNQSGIFQAQKPELVVQTGHSDEVTSVAFSPDGRVLASGSRDSTVKLWDVSTGKVLRTLKGHSEGVLSVAFSPDGRSLASSSQDGTIKLWAVATGKVLRPLKGHDYWTDVTSVAFSPHGKTLVSGSSDKSVKLWDVSTGKVLHTLYAQYDATGKVLRTLYEARVVNSVAFSPNGKTLASGSETVRLWSVSTGKELRPLKGHADLGSVNSVAFSPDGKTLASASARFEEATPGFGKDKGTVKLWDVSTSKELRNFTGQVDLGSVTAVVFSPDGKTLASGESTMVRLWDVSTGTELRGLKENSDLRSVSVAFSPDGKTLASASAGFKTDSAGFETDKGTVKLWDVSTGTELHNFKGQVDLGSVTSVAFSPDGKILASGGGHTVKPWDVSTGTELRTFKGHSDIVTSVAFSPDGKTLASGSEDNTVKLWDVSTGTELRTLKGHHDWVTSVAFSPDGKTLASASADFRSEGTVKLWDVSTGAALRTLSSDTSKVTSIAFSPDGKTLASGESTMVRLWDVSTGRVLRALKEHFGGVKTVTSVAFSPDGKTLASGTEYGSPRGGTSIGIDIGQVVPQPPVVKLWDVSTGAELRTLRGHAELTSVTSVAFSPDGKTLASGSDDYRVRLWRVSTGKLLRTLEGNSDVVRSVAFSLNNEYLASGSLDGTIKVWQVSSGTELASLVAFDEFDWLVVTPDGLFDGSPAAWNKIIWLFNNDSSFSYAPIEAFYNEFYYPGLLTDIFAGKRPKASSDISQKDRRQPQLNLTLNSGQSVASSTARNVTARIDISQAPAGAQDVRLFRNGSLVKVWRGDVLQGKSSVTLETTIPIVAGENRLTAYAFNHDNIKSSDVSLAVNGAESLKRQGAAYILAVGVNSYSNPQYNLKYAVPDAEDFSAEIKRQQGTLKNYARVEVIPLYDKDATKANILQKLTQLANTAQPEDAVIVYFSGHGTAQQQRFFLIPFDLGYQGPRTQLSAADLQTILEHSISDRELEAAFEQIDAGQLLMVIDACNSGQALDSEEKRRGPMNSKGLAQLAYEKGMYILTAAQSYQAAWEASKLGHGYLTYALVEEGLKHGAADREPKDGAIVLREWLNYATEQVPRMQEEKMKETPEIKDQQGRELEFVFVEGDESIKDPAKRSIQRPRVFYRREPERQPLIVARP